MSSKPHGLPFNFETQLGPDFKVQDPPFLGMGWIITDRRNGNMIYTGGVMTMMEAVAALDKECSQ